MKTSKQVVKLFDAAMEDIKSGNFDSVVDTGNGMIYRLGRVEIEFDYGYDCVPEISAEMSVKFYTSEVDDFAVASLHERDRKKMREHWKKNIEQEIERLQRELKNYE